MTKSRWESIKRIPTVTIEEIELQGDYSLVDSVRATCDESGHETESFGTSEQSVARCQVLMKQECPDHPGVWHEISGGDFQ